MCFKKEYESLILYSFLLSDFVRYTGKPKDRQSISLLSTAFGTENRTDKMVMGKGGRVEIFQRSVLKNTTRPLTITKRGTSARPPC
jgi:hypothetical protein